jgi:hypothetical protein
LFFVCRFPQCKALGFAEHTLAAAVPTGGHVERQRFMAGQALDDAFRWLSSYQLLVSCSPVNELVKVGTWPLQHSWRGRCAECGRAVAFGQQRERFVDVMRHAIALNGSFFNTQRMVLQYVLKAYFE